MAEEVEISGRDKTEDAFDLAGLLLEYLGNWKWFVLSVIVCLTCAYFHIATIIPVYQVTASIYLAGDAAANTANAVSITGESILNQKDFIDETEIEIMKSRNNMIKIVDSLNLSTSYAEVGRFRDIPVYGTNPVVVKLDSVSLHNLSAPITILANKDDDGYVFDIKTSYGGTVDHRKVTAAKLPAKVETSQGTLTFYPSEITSKFDKTLKITIQSPLAVAGRLSGSLGIQFAPNSTTILRITFNTPVIQEGIDVIHALISFYNADIIADKNRSAMQTEAFILDRLVMIAGELKDVEERLEHYRRVNNIVDLNTQGAMNLNRKSNTENELADVSVQQEILNAVETAIARQDNYTPIAQMVDNPELSSQIEAYNKKLSQRERMLQSSTEDNPMVQQMQDDLASQKSVILQGLRSVKSQLAHRRSSIASQRAETAGELANLPPIDKGLQEIFREQQVKVNIYTFLLQKREEIALQKTLATPTARLIDNPGGGGMVSPRTTMIYGVALLIGLLIPAVLIFLRRLIFPVFKDKEEVERTTKVPVLSEISNVKRDTHIVVSSKDTSAEAELFRLLRNNVQFILGKERKVILVTSSLSGEGKTFIASNLAMSFALTGRRTLVVGLDIRRPVLAHNFGLSNQEGITTYLVGQTDDWHSLVKPSGLSENLYVLPAGPVPPNPNELLLSDRLDILVEELREAFDYIILDTAPIGLVSDSLLVARVSDIQLYVARANYSTRRCIKMMHTAVNSGRFGHTYVVLNGVNMLSNAYRYRHYGSYGGYGSSGSKGYGYGYRETPLPSSRLRRLWRRARRR